MRGLFRGLFTLKGFLKYGTLAICLVAVAVFLYFNTVMRPHPFLSYFEGLEAQSSPPSAGQVQQFVFDGDRSTLEITDGAMLEELWTAMDSTQLRYWRYISAAMIPENGVYYEVTLQYPDGTPLNFAIDSSGQVVVKSRTYKLVGESGILPALDALFTQYEAVPTPAS